MEFVNPKTGQHPYLFSNDSSKPNIFLISIDMVPPEFYQPESRYSNILNIPNIRNLFDSGVLFTNAFSASPLCGPSRASYLTGRYPYMTVNEERSHDGQAVALRSHDIVFPEYLKASGYHTRHVGKSHVGTELFLRAFGENDSPWNRWAPPITDDDDYLDYCSQIGVSPLRFRKEIRGLSFDGKKLGNLYGGWVEQENEKAFPIEATYPWYLAEKACRTVRSAMSRVQNGDSIYLQLDFFAPHQPFMIPAGFEQRAMELEKIIVLPDSFNYKKTNQEDGDVLRPRIYGFYRRRWGILNEEIAKQYILANMIQMEVLDRAIGHFLEELKLLSIYDDSVICLLGDHGEMNTECGLIDKGVYGHPKVARAPLAIKLSGNKMAGMVRNCLVSLLDVAPTLLSLAGIEPLARLDGENLIGYIEDKVKTRQKPILFECLWHAAPNPAVGIIAETESGRKMMYTENLTSDIDELYDLEDWSFENRVFNRLDNDDKAEMIAKLVKVLNSDKRWVPYREVIKIDKPEFFAFDGSDGQMFIPE